MSERSVIPELFGRRDEADRKYAQLQRRYLEVCKEKEELSTFREIGLATNSILDFEEILETVVWKVTALFDAPVGVIYLLEPGTDRLVAKIARHDEELRREEDLRNESFPVGEGPVGEALAERLGNVVEEPDGCSSLVEPLIAKHEGIGVIKVSRRNSQPPFTRNDSNLLSVISSQVAVAIHNAILYSLATTDYLTKLYVRRYFDSRLTEEFFAARRYKKPLSLLMIDIDHFKGFNDRHGHQTGDFVLKETARIIVQNCRRSDIPCRYGGEEIAVILAATGLDGAITVGQKIRDQISEKEFSFDKVQGLTISVSIGVASYRIGMRSPEDLVASADKALYEAKRKGRNRVAVGELAQPGDEQE